MSKFYLEYCNNGVTKYQQFFDTEQKLKDYIEDLKWINLINERTVVYAAEMKEIDLSKLLK